MVHYRMPRYVNCFDSRPSRRRPVRDPGQPSAVVTAQDERRRWITLGLMMTFASLAAQPHLHWSCRLKTGDFSSAPVTAPADRCREPRGRLGLALYVPHALPEARGLGVTIRRRQCRHCRRPRCLCVFWRIAPAADCRLPQPPIPSNSLIGARADRRVRFEI